MADTKLHHRAFALTMAALFLFTAVATGAAVIYSVYSANKTNNTSNNTTKSNSSMDTHLAGTQLQGFTPVSDVSTLQIKDLKEGTGATVTSSSTVSVLYSGAVAATGKIFQASTDSGPSPVSFAVSSVIQGWQKGLPGMKVGGERQLLIPANEAYGANPPPGSGIPANAALVFNITLLSSK